MYLNLQAALTDERFELALRRLYNVVRLEGRGLPDDVMDSPRSLLAQSKAEFGDGFSKVQALYPEYQKWADKKNEELIDWQVRCSRCKFQGDEMASGDAMAWCDKYSALNRTFPEPCPGFVIRGDADN